jgi:hypothetical protein
VEKMKNRDEGLGWLVWLVDIGGLSTLIVYNKIEASKVP